MSGHSKWSSIKHRKGAADIRRGKLFTKLGRAVTIAARDGGGDPTGNPALALAVQRAKEASMPKDNIDRAIARGTGAGADAAAIERVAYEGYGPAGVAMLVETLTDNRNRTGSEVRHAFTRHGGSLGEPGSVAWIFEKKGVIIVDAGAHAEDDLIAAIDAGAEDLAQDGDSWSITTEASDLSTVRAALEDSGVAVQSAEISMEPKSTVQVEGKDAERVLKLLDALEEHDDVNEVWANFDIDAEILQALA